MSKLDEILEKFGRGYWEIEENMKFHLVDYKNTAKSQIKDLLPSEEEIEKYITDYFILEKKFLKKKKQRMVMFGEDDSQRIAKAIYELIRGKL